MKSIYVWVSMCISSFRVYWYTGHIFAGPYQQDLTVSSYGLGRRRKIEQNVRFEAGLRTGRDRG